MPLLFVGHRHPPFTPHLLVRRVGAALAPPFRGVSSPTIHPPSGIIKQ